MTVTVQDATFDYLLSSPAPKIRISAYLDRDWESVLSTYAEVFVRDDCQFATRIEAVLPGSKTRKDIELPGPMYQGEQLTVIVSRISID